MFSKQKTAQWCIKLAPVEPPESFILRNTCSLYEISHKVILKRIHQEINENTSFLWFIDKYLQTYWKQLFLRISY